jgi:hypothetical protein
MPQGHIAIVTCERRDASSKDCADRAKRNKAAIESPDLIKGTSGAIAARSFLVIFGWNQWLPELTALDAMRAFVDAYSEPCADASCPGCPHVGI